MSVMTAEAFHDAWVEHGMRCDGTHATGEALCQNVVAMFATQPDLKNARAALASHEAEPLREALEKLPPGPYEVQWPAEQGGPFVLMGKQGIPPDFTDGWAIPIVAYGVDTAINALHTILTTLTETPGMTFDMDSDAAFALGRSHGLDVERLARAMAKDHQNSRNHGHCLWTDDHLWYAEQVAAEYDRHASLDTEER